MNEELLPLCECGCGLRVTRKGNRFLSGHNRCKMPWKPKPEPQLCKCGCGELAEPGNRFIHGHGCRGKKLSQERILEMSKYQTENPSRGFLGKRHSQESIDKISKTKSCVLVSEEQKIKISKTMKGRQFSDSHKAALSAVWKDHPEIWDDRNEAMRGGNDIVKHHFIYDHNHPENHTVEITRAKHISHHAWMKRVGLEVPHINMKEVNK